MATISLCMIVRDEARVLGRCLESVQDAVDEIIIADTGSVDNTREIALQFTEHVYDFPWCDDFAAARNFAFSKASMDYQMWLDADDVMLFPDCEALRALKETLTADVVMMPYHVAFDAQGSPTFSYYRERLLRRACGFRWEGAVHEAITPAGNILYADPAVRHQKEYVNDPDRNLRIFEKQLSNGKTLSPREQYYYARELFYHERFAEAAGELTAFLEGEGWTEDKISACLQLSRCHAASGDMESAKTALFRSFLYGEPRSEICCEIGRLLMEEERWQEAVFWYRAALDAPFSDSGFTEGDTHDYIPDLQLCVCFDRLGNLRTAKAYNDRAGRIKPHDAAYLANRAYFQRVLR